MTKRKSNPEQHYQRIIDAADDLFVEQGFHATSLFPKPGTLEHYLEIYMHGIFVPVASGTILK